MYNNSCDLSEFWGTANNYYTLKLVWNQETLWKVNVKMNKHLKFPGWRDKLKLFCTLKWGEAFHFERQPHMQKEGRTDFKKNKNNLVLVGSII